MLGGDTIGGDVGGGCVLLGGCMVMGQWSLARGWWAHWVQVGAVEFLYVVQNIVEFGRVRLTDKWELKQRPHGQPF